MDEAEAPKTLLARLRSYFDKHRFRLLRYGVALFVLYAVVDLVSSNAQDAELVFALGPIVEGVSPRPARVTVSVLADDGALMTHTELPLPPDLENLHFTASVPPGEYSAIVEMPGVLAHEGHFAVPTEAALRVNLSPRP
jgi:hypothetical protein